MIIGSYDKDGEHQDDGRCERGMDMSGDYRCECKWEVASTVIVQGVDGLRAVEGTTKVHGEVITLTVETGNVQEYTHCSLALPRVVHFY